MQSSETTRICFCYREIVIPNCLVGTVEEKIFQRQLSKEGLSNVVNQSGKSAASIMSADELADVFTLRGNTMSDTYDSMASYDLSAATLALAPSSHAVINVEDDLGAPAVGESGDGITDAPAADAAGGLGGGVMAVYREQVCLIHSAKKSAYLAVNPP